jgi:hypothetical protein
MQLNFLPVLPFYLPAPETITSEMLIYLYINQLYTLLSDVFTYKYEKNAKKSFYISQLFHHVRDGF